MIALACRTLPEKHRKIGIILGAGAAILLRIIFALIVTLLLGVPYLKVVGGLLLLWIAVKLLADDEHTEHNIEGGDTLWKAVRTVAIADAVMSLDNVVAIAAAARGHAELFIFGLLLSIPLIVIGAQIIMTMIQRFPILVWAGAALLGWIAGEMIVSDKVVLEQFMVWNSALVVLAPHDPIGMAPAKLPFFLAAGVGAAIVVLIGLFRRRRSRLAEGEVGAK